LAATGEIPDVATVHADPNAVHPTNARQPIVIVCVTNNTENG
tara:strand:- start:1503 stop:1628 length:126 start_codon:yes stop_codon:yes gene_type:complete